MNIVFIKHVFVGCMVSEISRVSVFGHCPYLVTFPYIYALYNLYFLNVYYFTYCIYISIYL